MSCRAHILLVEDNPMDVELTLDAFREIGLLITVHVATNGQQALDYLFGREQYADRHAFPNPDLILLDLKLPGVSGVDVLRIVKETPHIRRIPVIILTSSEEEIDRANCYDNGANSYLVKPVSFDGFLAIVRTIDEYWLSLNVAPPQEIP